MSLAKDAEDVSTKGATSSFVSSPKRDSERSLSLSLPFITTFYVIVFLISVRTSSIRTSTSYSSFSCFIFSTSILFSSA